MLHGIMVKPALSWPSVRLLRWTVGPPTRSRRLLPGRENPTRCKLLGGVFRESAKGEGMPTRWRSTKGRADHGICASYAHVLLDL